MKHPEKNPFYHSPSIVGQAMEEGRLALFNAGRRAMDGVRPHSERDKPRIVKTNVVKIK